MNNRPIKIDPKAPAVKSVRSIPPQNFEPTARKKSVAEFYQQQLAAKPISKAKLATMYVGPFRPEFVWWAYGYWSMEDRAWWAWNNRT